MEHVSSEFSRLLTMAGREAPADCHARTTTTGDGAVDQGNGAREGIDPTTASNAASAVAGPLSH